MASAFQVEKQAARLSTAGRPELLLAGERLSTAVAGSHGALALVMPQPPGNASTSPPPPL
jgi:hypothetical protein